MNVCLLQFKVSTDEGEQLASELGVPFIETSALSGSHIEEAFVTMTANIKASVDRRGLSGLKLTGKQQTGGVQLAAREKQKGILGALCGCSA